jgi:hypothetical protein
MNCVSLILSFVSQADHKRQVRSASRIQLAGKGEILLYDEDGNLDRLPLQDVKELKIQSVASFLNLAYQA